MPRGSFATSQWNLVLAARGGPASPEAALALAELCAVYWYPVYAFVRRQGTAVEDAKDLTQGFFAELLAKGVLKSVGSERGRFRAFLKAAVRHFTRASARARSSAAVAQSWFRSTLLKPGIAISMSPRKW